MTIVEKQNDTAQTNRVEFSLIKGIFQQHVKNYHPYLDEMYNNYFMLNPDRHYQLKKDDDLWRSNMVSPLTYMYTSTIYDLAKDAQIVLSLGDISKTIDQGTSNILRDEIMDLAQYIMGSQNFMDTFFEAFFDSVLTGVGYYHKTYYYSKEKDTYTVINEDGTSSEETTEDLIDVPGIAYISPYNIVTQTTRRDIDSKYSIKRKLIPLEKVEQTYAAYGLKLSTDFKDKQKKGSGGDVLSYTDFDSKIRNLPLWKFSFNPELLQGDYIDKTTEEIYKKKYVEVIELVDDKTIAIYCNGQFQNRYKKILGFGMKLDHCIRYRKGTTIGVGYVAYESQKAYDEIINNRYDNVKLIMNKVFMVDSRVKLFGSSDQIKLKPGLVIKVPGGVNEKIDFVKEIPISDIKSSSYEEANGLFQMLQAALGVGANVLGQQGKVERTAEGASIVRGAADRQVKQLIDSAQENLSSTIRDLVILAKINMNSETLTKILGEDNMFSELDVLDIKNNFIFDFSIQSQQFGSKATKIQQLMQMIEMAGRVTDSAGNPVADAASLYRKLVKEFDIDVDADLTDDELVEHAKKRFNVQRLIQSGDSGEGQPEAPIEDPLAGPGVDGAQSVTDMFKISGPGTGMDGAPNPNGING